MWTYRCYNDGKDPNLWQRWYRANKAARGAHDNAFRMLEQREEWQEPNAKHLGKGLIEVKFKGVDKRQWRIFGYHTAGEHRDFTVIGVGYHKDRVYTPRDAIPKAREIKADIEHGRAEAYPCERPQVP